MPCAKSVIIVRTAAWLVALCAAAPATADVYKCRGDGNVPVYQEMPCPPGKELRDFQLDPPAITVLPGTGARAGTPAPARPRPPNDGTATRRPAKAGAATNDGKTAAAGGDPAERRHLRTGMTAAEVRLRIGVPDGTTSMRRTKSERWTYQPAPGDPETITTVTLVDGVVTNVERTVVKR
jgi:hypothetical protein